MFGAKEQTGKSCLVVQTFFEKQIMAANHIFKDNLKI